MIAVDSGATYADGVRFARVNETGSETLSERIEWDGRVLTVSWLALPFRPERRLTTQVLGLCFTRDGQIILVSDDEDGWTLPGGHPEAGESLEGALERELREEASARLVACEYIGCQRVEDPDRLDGPALYFQARYWARVELYPFESSPDAIARCLIQPDEFRATLAWGTAAAAQAILAAGLSREQARTHLASQG